jgi:isopentenyl phosphate kinase
MKIYTYSPDEIQAMCNDAAWKMVAKLITDGFIDKENTLEELVGEYAIVVHEKGAFGHLFSKLFKLDDAGLYLRVIRLG